MAMKIGIPVECQNGHKATWRMLITGLEKKDIGVKNSENCKCPKFDFGEGWKACGEPFFIGYSEGSEWQ